MFFTADAEKFKFPEENPFAASEDSDEEGAEAAAKTSVASVGYRYR